MELLRMFSSFSATSARKGTCITSEISATQRQCIAHHRIREILGAESFEGKRSCRRKDTAAFASPASAHASHVDGYKSARGSHSENLKRTCRFTIARKLDPPSFTRPVSQHWQHFDPHRYTGLHHQFPAASDALEQWRIH